MEGVLRRGVAVPVVLVGIVLLLLLSRTVAERRAAARATVPAAGRAREEWTRQSDAPFAARPEHQVETVHVQVLDATNRTPIAGAAVNGATTDARGYATLALDRCAGVSLLACTRGFVPREYWLDEKDEDPWIPLRRGFPVSVRVVHADGTPAVRAEVVLFTPGLKVPFRPDSTGCVEIPGLPEEEVRVRAGEEGYATVEVEFTASPENTTLEIVLGAGGACEGVVVDEEGRPVADARVLVIEEFLSGLDFFEVASCRSDEHGRFAIRGLPPLYPCVPQCGPGPRLLDDRYRLRATTQDRAGESERFAADPDAPPHRCEIVVRSASYVVVNVTYPDGTPVAGASVRGCLPRAGEPGLYESGPVPQGPFEILVFDIDGWERQRFTVDVGPGRNDVPVLLEEGLALTGTVVDRDGAPLRGISVSFEDAQTWTGADGAFLLRGLLDEAGTLAIGGDDHATLSVLVRPGQPPLHIVLDRASRVVGRIEPAPALREFDLLFGEADGTSGDTGLVGRDGRFDVAAPPDTLWIKIEAEGSAPWVFQGLHLSPGGTLDLGILRAHQGATLRGVVVDREGGPVRGAVVSVEAEDEDLAIWSELTTDEEGCFEFVRLPEIPLVLTVGHEAYVTHRLRIAQPGSTAELRIVLEPGGVLEVAATPSDNFGVEVEALGSGEVMTVFTSQAESHSVRLLPGRYRVGDRVVEIREGETASVDPGE